MWISIFIVLEILAFILTLLSFLLNRSNNLDFKTYGLQAIFFHIAIYGSLGFIYLLLWILSLNL